MCNVLEIVQPWLRYLATLLKPFITPLNLNQIQLPIWGSCSIFNEEKVITSKNTGRKYEIKNERNVEINCTTENVVYLLECDHCKLQYVGETNQQLSRRFSSHKNNIRKYDTTKKDTQLIEHFNYGMCKDKTYNVKII